MRSLTNRGCLQRQIVFRTALWGAIAAYLLCLNPSLTEGQTVRSKSGSTGVVRADNTAPSWTELPKLSMNGGEPEDMHCFVLNTGRVFRNQPAKQAPVTEENAEFLRTAGVVEISKSSDDTYALLAVVSDRKISRYLGWIPTGQCLFYADRRGRTKIEALRDATTGIPRKCMLVRDVRPEGESRGIDPNGEVQVGFYFGPDANAKRKEIRSLFGIYYVYAETASSLFVGEDPSQLIKAGAAPQMLIGWVNKQAVEQWNTREAIGFNKRDFKFRDQKCPSVIFRDLRDLKEFLTSRSPTEKLEALRKENRIIGVENMNESNPPPHDSPRYPILGGIDPKTLMLSGKNQIYKIGVIGDVVDKANKVVVAKDALAKAQSQADQILQDARQVEIALVIDASEELQSVAGAVKSSVIQMVDRVGNYGGGSSQLKVSVTYCRGAYERSNPASLEHIPFMKDSGEIAARIDQKQFFGGGLGKGKSVARIYAGIEKSLEKSKFSPGATKILIVIGATPNDSDDVAIASGVANKVVQAAGSNNVALRLFCFGDAGASDSKVFLGQMSALADAINAHEVENARKGVEESARNNPAVYTAERKKKEIEDTAHALKSRAAGIVTTRSPAEVADSIRDVFKAKLDEAIFKADKVRMSVTGTSPESATGPGATQKQDPLGLAFEMQVVNQLVQRGASDLLKARGNFQLFTEGYVTDFHPGQVKPAGWKGEERPYAVEHLALLHGSEVAKLKQTLQISRELAKDPDSENWKKLVELLAPGRKIDNDVNLQELVRMHGGLYARTGLLRFTPQDLTTLSNEKRQEMDSDLERCISQLEDVLDEADAEYVRVPETGAWDRVPGKGGRKFWWGTSTRNTELASQKAWVPREFLP